jgi:hypothetical protein
MCDTKQQTVQQLAWKVANARSQPVLLRVQPFVKAPNSHPLESSESENFSSHSQDELLVGCEGDPLIPTAEEINRTYIKAQSLWQTLVKDASSFPSGCFPTSSLDPSIIMQDVPPLPLDLSGQLSIKGQSMWNVAIPDIRTPAFARNDDGCDPELVYGVHIGS